jgi:DNA-binding XRE family transcriptional regulator
MSDFDRALSSHNRKLASDYEKNLEAETDTRIFSDRLRAELIAIRKSNGLTLEAFGHCIGASKQNVWAVEQGAGFSLEYVDKVDRAFGVWK